MKQFALNTKFRVLLTETLPYELPIIWDNSGFVMQLNNGKAQSILDTIQVSKEQDTIPYDYYTRQKGGEKSRKLSVPHPNKQLQWCDIYDQYDEYMTYLCSKSPFSLRYIHKIANYLINTEDLELGDGAEDTDYYDANWNKQYSNYFTYKRFNGIYKFYDTEDFLRLEQKYKYMMQTDVNGCFYHIYTHSVAWAVKGKDFAKATKQKKSFENELDGLMQQTNYGETNGIIIGPEFSRIFAEIILQQIDVNLINLLKATPYHYHVGAEYEIRRYVDDYYIFTNKIEILDDIKRTLIQCLEFYKLDLNTSKTSIIERPVWTNQSNAKDDISRLITELFDSHFKHLKQSKCKSKTKKNTVKKNTDNTLVFTQFVKRYEYIVNRNDIKNCDVNSYLLTIIKRNIEKWNFNLITAEYQESIVALIKLCCFICSLDMNYSDITKLCLILNKLHAKTTDRILRNEIDATIEREIKRLCELFIDSLKEKENNIEILNLLIILDRVSHKGLSKDRIALIFGKKKASEINSDSFKNLEIFQIEVLLYLIGDRIEFNDWKEWILDKICSLFSKKNWTKYADLYCLYLDLMVCKHLTDKQKNAIIRVANNLTGNKVGRHRVRFNDIARWFINWEKDSDLEMILEKKQYHSKYR